MNKRDYDVVVLGAGAAGMMAAIEAGKRGRRVLVLDHAKAPGEKIRISGGGRCNFTNVHTSPKAFLSQNPHFCISALKRYTPQDFVALVQKHGIAFHEKALGQLFCDDSAKQIIQMLVQEMRNASVRLQLSTDITKVSKSCEGYEIETSGGLFGCQSLIVALGGKSIPKMGATSLGYQLAEQFGLKIIEQRPALVPFTLNPEQKQRLAPLSGVAHTVTASSNGASFNEAMLITHRGLSGPSMLQVSSYWREGQEIAINWLPKVNASEMLLSAKGTNPRQELQTLLAEHMAKNLAVELAEQGSLAGKRLADVPDKTLAAFGNKLNGWPIKPEGTEGYRTAEVTLGGVDTKDLDQKTMMAKNQQGLYFIGEVVDVTGWLGGYNFQWAWASGWVAGQVA